MHLVKTKILGQNSNCAGHSRKFTEGGATSPTNPEKGRAGKRKTNYSDRLRDVSNDD